MTVGRARRAVSVAIAVIALAILLFPPWRAIGIRTTTRYAAVPAVVPSVVTDTLRWTLAFAPIYAPPRADLDGQHMRQLATRSLAGDPAAARELRRSTEAFERRYHVPEVLRAAGALWRDSVLARAGIPSVTSYDVNFAIDQRWISARLVVLIGLGAFILRRRA